ncbi:hypothetical protein FKM82_010145 [Ascaphus truei]
MHKYDIACIESARTCVTSQEEFSFLLNHALGNITKTFGLILYCLAPKFYLQHVKHVWLERDGSLVRRSGFY